MGTPAVLASDRSAKSRRRHLISLEDEMSPVSGFLPSRDAATRHAHAWSLGSELILAWWVSANVSALD